VLGHAQVASHRLCRSAPGQIGEERQGAARRAATVDAVEALIEGALVAVLTLADESAHAHRQGDDDRADDIDDARQSVPIGRSRRAPAAGTRRYLALAGHMHHRPSAGLIDGAEQVHVAPAEARGDTVGHELWLPSSAR